MSSGRAVEKPAPMTGRATPWASSGMTRASQSNVTSAVVVTSLASAAVQTPSPLTSRRTPEPATKLASPGPQKPSATPSGPVESTRNWPLVPSGLATSATVHRPSPVVSTLQVAAIAKARTVKMSLSSPPSRRSSDWLEYTVKRSFPVPPTATSGAPVPGLSQPRVVGMSCGNVSAGATLPPTAVPNGAARLLAPAVPKVVRCVPKT